MIDADLPAAIDRAVHRGVGIGILTSLVRRAARGESTAGDLDAFAGAIARHYADSTDPNVTKARVIAALEAS